MATQLQPQTLDIEITKITAKRVHYRLWSNKAKTFWEIPPGSTFNTSVLVVGTRYTVDSDVVLVQAWDHLKRKKVVKQRFDWRAATPSAPKVRLQARTKKQREADEARAVLSIVDNAELFSW